MHNNTHNSKMMWWMMAACLLLPVGILLFSGKGFSSGNWLFLGFLVICVGGHALMMRGMHGDEKTGKEENPDTHQDH